MSMAWNLSMLSLTLVMRLLSRSQGLPSQTQTHTWPRSQRSWQRILGKLEELLTQLLLHAIAVNQHISNHGLVIKWLLLHFCISTHPTPNLPEMSPETYLNQKHTRREIMGNVLKHTLWTQYEANRPMFQLPQYLCITKLFSRNTFPSASYLCPKLYLSPNSTCTVTSPNTYSWYLLFALLHQPQCLIFIYLSIPPTEL